MDTLVDETFTPASLDDAIDGVTPEPEAQEVAATPETEATPEAPVLETPAKPAEQEQPAAPESWTYAMAMDEKSKRQALEKKVQDFERQQSAREWQEKQAQKPVEAPDIFTDQAAYDKYIQEQTLGQVMPVVATLQRQVASQVHGAEKLDAATQWFNSLEPSHQTALNNHYGQQPDPYAGLIAEFNKAELAKEMSDPAQIQAFRAWQASQSGQPIAEQPAQAPTAPAAPRPSQVQLTPSVMSAPSVAPRSGPVWAAPKTLSELLPE